jgi:hypothetical protein
MSKLILLVIVEIPKVRVNMRFFFLSVYVQTWPCTMSKSFHVNLSFPGPVVIEKICTFVIIFPSKTSCLIWRILNYLTMDVLHRLWLKMVCELWRRLKKISALFHFCYFLPRAGALPFIWTILSSPFSAKNDLCQVRLKLVKWFRKRGQK